MHLDIDGLLLLAAGLFIRYLIGRRRFYRRNAAGMPVYSGYLASLLIKFLEWLLNGIGLLLILFGLITCLF
ncbi:MAG: hypothetical protein V4594_21680 [Bacteroidota bacterium]